MQTAIRFLRTLFDEGDIVLFRPIETWHNAQNKKFSRVEDSQTRYIDVHSNQIYRQIEELFEESALQNLNLFFGVCPRFGKGRRFDLASQIRTARSIWTDIDHLSYDDAIKLVERAGIPEPSTVVNSGNGVHLYWLLDNAFVVDDVDPPCPVETEWTRDDSGCNSRRKYILKGDEKIWLDEPGNRPSLSPQAKHFQAVVDAVSKACKGDHTSDLSRLLRLPGSVNRKNARNGQLPKPTELIKCDADQRYSLAIFEQLLALRTHSRKRDSEQVIARSPDGRLDELIHASATAPKGTRSDADFRLCCYAIEHQFSKDELWRRVESIGKFAERGEEYFARTWMNAQQRTAPVSKAPIRSDDAQHLKCMTSETSSALVNSVAAEGSHRERFTIFVKPRDKPVSNVLCEITHTLQKAGDCYRRSGQLVTIREGQIYWIRSATEFAGLLNQFVEFYFDEPRAKGFRPLSPSFANTWLYKPTEVEKLPEIRLFTRCPAFDSQWELISTGFNSAEGIYYAGEKITPRDDTNYLDSLLRDFCFQENADRTNYLGILLTSLMIPRFIGSKPAVLFNGNQSGLGKTVLAQIIAILRDGHAVETASYNPNEEEFEKRLGSIVRSGATTIIIDNAKNLGRNNRIESAVLERSITDPILSFRILGRSTDFKVENSHMFCLTANAPQVSRDLMTRCVVVNLFHEGNPSRRKFSISDPEEFALENRSAILGEIAGMIVRWMDAGRPQVATSSRFNKRDWGNIVGGILSQNDEPDFLANANDAAQSLDDTHADFHDLIKSMAEHPGRTWTAKELVKFADERGLLKDYLGFGSPRSRETRMGLIATQFAAERFELTAEHAERWAVFQKIQVRKGYAYQVECMSE